MNRYTYYVYIVANATRVLYIGITSNLTLRVWQHKQKFIQGFTSNWHVCRLVYFESWPEVNTAIRREKQLMNWRREKKIKLIEISNRNWHNLSDGWYSDWDPAKAKALPLDSGVRSLARGDNLWWMLAVGKLVGLPPLPFVSLRVRVGI